MRSWAELAVLCCLVIPASASQPDQEAGPAPTLLRSIALPGVRGRIDHLAFDPTTKRLFVAALENGSLEVVDLEVGARVAGVRDLDEPQGIAFVPSTNQVVVACGGDGTVRTYDAQSLETRAVAHIGDDADNIRLGPEGSLIIVGYGSGSILALDAQTLAASARVNLPGHPEAFALEPDGDRAFVNVPGGFLGAGGQVVVADFAKQEVHEKWTLREAGRNYPMALDPQHERLYVGCRRPAKLLVLDAESGRIVASPDCVGDADEVFLDSKTGRVLVIGGDGAIDVFATTDNADYAKIASISTEPGARTGLLVSESMRLYLAVPRRAGKDAEIREYSLPD